MSDKSNGHHSSEDNGVGRNLLAFRLNQQNFALSLEPITQIVPMVTITPLPQLDPSVLGVVNLRGKPVPVIDLALAFGYPKTVLKVYTPIIFVIVGSRVLGLVVDEVSGVINLGDTQVIRLKDILPGSVGDAPLLKGVAHLPQGLFPLIDLDQVFSRETCDAFTETMQSIKLPVLEPEVV
jgi:purine-binding chemotaxis protein CheW